jgi:N6-adenosine-specific RNA methylase IME4
MVIFSKGDLSDIAKYHSMNDVLVAPFRGQSVKPTEIYDCIKKLVSKGHYLEVYARENNIQSNFVSIGNQLRKR